ncbi:MAG TPA: uroporphyrinogen-III synthase [Ureibacillus sp.]|uniref:uroporphyrinogen-III synthase n=1 Tax=Peribacillus asahii TaxID=228899 RepID=UPI002079FE4E|nr:uroporphyrinogen-III synthase [Peribacillus asahii]USK57938.1 uroporphyrinogen-III synthase [Peribacillus asahii]HWL24979.1 uroporphyrinogen-III synthase [Ureibacillus sp.]
MGKGLAGKRIAIGGSRKVEEISTLIEKQGGISVVRPLQGTVFLAEKEVEPDLQKFVMEGADWVIFTTGIGTETLLNLAETLGIKDQFLNRIQQASVASRGYKTLSTLKKIGIKPVATDEDGTTRGLIRSLENFDFSGKRVMVQLHGETAPTLIKFLEDRGASVLTILPYQHIAPESETVAKLCEELLNNELDAVCFTTAIQVRSLFNFARENGCLTDILQSFQGRALAAAVGKVTAEALVEEGVERLLAPELERMGAMIIELSRYYEKL